MMLLRRFKRHYNKVEKLIPKLQSDNAFSLHIQSDGKSISVRNSTPTKELTTRFIVLMRRFLNKEDALYLAKVWGYLKENFENEIPIEAVEAIGTCFDAMNRSVMNLQVNDEVLNPERIYQIISEGEYFQRNENVRKYLTELTDTQLVGPLLWYQFYEYTLSGLNMASLIARIISVIEQTDKYRTQYHTKNLESSICIFCLRNDGGFSSEEHVIPEALGNDEMILPRGVVCDRCNNTLSQHDTKLAQFEPVAFLQLQFVSYTKSGKLPPVVKFQNVHFEKDSPQNIIIRPQDKSGEMLQTEDLGGGWFKFQMQMKGKRFDVQSIGRSLYKIGLELVAYHAGLETARNNKYSAARNFVLHGGDFNNNLLMSSNVVPTPYMQTQLREDPQGTFVLLFLYGLVFMFNLEEEPKMDVNEQLKELDFVSFALHKKYD